MLTRILTSAEVLAGYDRVCSLYEHVPSLSLWRGWECAAYHKFQLSGRVLDLGCGDGNYFRLLWPGTADVVGVDQNAAVAALARRSGVYREVHECAAHELRLGVATFDAVFANCSLEHMDHLDQVLERVHHCLRPGGVLLCSVVTEKFLDWSLLPRFVAAAGAPDAARQIQREFEDVHHLVSPFPVQEWLARFMAAKLRPEEHVPILPKVNSGFFLLLDGLWHLKLAAGGELGGEIGSFLCGLNGFGTAFRGIVEALLQLESDPALCSGAVFLARKPE